MCSTAAVCVGAVSGYVFVLRCVGCFLLLCCVVRFTVFTLPLPVPWSRLVRNPVICLSLVRHLVHRLRCPQPACMEPEGKGVLSPGGTVVQYLASHKRRSGELHMLVWRGYPGDVPLRHAVRIIQFYQDMSDEDVAQ